MFSNTVLSFLSSFVIISLRKRELVVYFNHVIVVMWLLVSECLVPVIVYDCGTFGSCLLTFQMNKTIRTMYFATF